MIENVKMCNVQYILKKAKKLFGHTFLISKRHNFMM